MGSNLNKNKYFRIALLLAAIFIAAEFSAGTHGHLFTLEQQSDCDICLVLNAGKLAVSTTDMDFSGFFTSGANDLTLASLCHCFLVYCHNRDPPAAIQKA